MGKKFGAFLLVLFFMSCLTVFLSMSPNLLVLMNSYQLAFWTLIAVFVPMSFVYLFLFAVGQRAKKSGSILMSLGASLFLFGGLFFFLVSVVKIGLNSSIALALLTPLFFIILTSIFTKESINASGVVAVVITALGGFLILYSKGLVYPESWASISYILGAALCWSVFSLIALKTKTSIFVNVYIYVLIGLISATILMLVQSSFIWPSYSSLGSIFIFALISLTAVFLWSGTFKYSGASFWTSMVFILPAVILLYDVIFKSAALPILSLIGLLVTGVAVVYRMMIRL